MQDGITHSPGALLEMVQHVVKATLNPNPGTSRHRGVVCLGSDAHATQFRLTAMVRWLPKARTDMASSETAAPSHTGKIP